MWPAADARVRIEEEDYIIIITRTLYAARNIFVVFYNMSCAVYFVQSDLLPIPVKGHIISNIEYTRLISIF